MALLAGFSNTNAEWLRSRRRKRWWKRRVFPRVPFAKRAPPAQPLAPGSAASLDGALLRKAAPLAVMFFCASFNLCLLSASKDALIVTAPGGGVEVIPFLMTYGVLPLSLLFTLCYSQLVERLPARLVFYAACLPLLAFYACFAFLLHPHAQQLHPHVLADALAAALPAGFSGLVGALRNWTFSLFFCAAELWGGVVISLLFWSLANEVCTVSEAKVVYPLLGIAANVALVAAGGVLRALNTLPGVEAGATLRLTVLAVLGGAVALFAAKAHVDRRLGPQQAAPRKRKKAALSAAQQLSALAASPKIRALAVLVVSYGLCHRLFEVAWKGQLRALHPDPGAYAAALGDVSTLTGAASIAMMLAARYIFQYAGWGVAAAATPVAMLLAGGGFFVASLAARAGGGTPALLAAAAAAGAVTQVCARTLKYSLFDPAKEMVFIGLNKEEKTQGKATVDLLGSQVGKSGASLTMQALLLCCGSLGASLPVMGAVFGAMVILWLNSVRQLNGTLLRESEASARTAAV